MTKKQIKSGFFVALAATAMFILPSAHAATIPPGNPFYPFQNGVRSLRRAFTFNPVGKALLEIRLVDERKSDIEQVLRVDTEESRVATAFQAYVDEVEALVVSAKGLSDERIADGVSDVFVRHGMASPEMRKIIIGLPQAVFGDQAGAVLRAHLVGALAHDASPFKELRAAELMTMFQMQSRLIEVVKDSERLKDDLLIAFVARVKSGEASLDALDAMPGDIRMRLQVLDEARARVTDLETRNALTAARARMLEKARVERRVTAGAVREALEYARSMARAAGVKNEQVAYFIEQAEKFVSENAYDIAVQHAVSADSAVNNAVLIGKITKKDVAQEVMLVKKQYDALAIPTVVIERRIAAIADMMGRVPAGEVLTALREVKFAIASASF